MSYSAYNPLRGLVMRQYGLDMPKKKQTKKTAADYGFPWIDWKESLRVRLGAHMKKKSLTHDAVREAIGANHRQQIATFVSNGTLGPELLRRLEYWLDLEDGLIPERRFSDQQILAGRLRQIADLIDGPAARPDDGMAQFADFVKAEFEGISRAAASEKAGTSKNVRPFPKK